MKLRTPDLMDRVKKCTLCHGSKKAQLAQHNPSGLKPDLSGIIVSSPKLLVVTSGTGKSLGDADWFLEILQNRYGLHRINIQVVPLVWCSEIKISVPSTRNCRDLIYGGVNKSSLFGIVLLGSPAIRYFLGAGESPPQAQMVFGREVRVHDIPYPIFLMPDRATLESLDPAAQVLRNRKKDLSERLSSFLGVSG